MQTIRRVLPEARFIHIIRDGRDAALSLRQMWFSPGWQIETQAAYWRKFVLAARRAGTGCTDYMEVRYEDLIRSPAETLKQVCSHINLNFDETMLVYYKHTPERLQEHKGRYRPDGAAWISQEVRLRQQAETMKPPNQTRVFVWKRAMSAEDQRRFQTVAGDLLEELGYDQ